MTKLKVSFSILMLVCMALVFALPAYSQQDEKLTREEFIDLIARYNPKNPLLPKNYSNLPRPQRYARVVETLNKKGFKGLRNKSREGLLTQVEFVRLTYAFTGAPAGKSLHHQKLYLKNAGILKSEDIGLATEIQGKVLQVHKGEKIENSAELASPVFMGDKIQTTRNSKARFTLDDGSTLTMAEDSIIRITKNIYNPDKDYRQMLIEVSLGAVRFVVTKVTAKGSMFKVVTPTVTAGVRGTEFIAIVKANGETRFIGIDGEIEITPILPDKRPGKTMALAINQTQVISNKGVASGIEKASQAMVRQAIKRTTMPGKSRAAKNASRDKAIKVAQNKRMGGHPDKFEDGDHRGEREDHSGPGGGGEDNETHELDKAAEEAAKDAERAAEEAAKDAEDAAEQAAKDAEDAAKDAAKEAEDAAEQAAKDAEDAAKDAAKEAEDAAKQAAKDAEDAAEEDNSGSGSGSSGSGSSGSGSGH